jgi:leader peptidase (prepilin peptidase)/N-methyltransferase
VEPLAVVLGLAGAAWGLAADRIAARWPAHEDGSVRKPDWRTIVVVGFGLASLAVVPGRFVELPERVLFAALFATCVLLLATDLDQRILPDELTLPLILVGAAVLVWGGDSLVNRQPAWFAVGGAIVIPFGLLALSIPFGEGAFGGGDVKFLAGAGLILGAIRLAIAVFVGAMLSGVVIVALIASRRISLHSYVPYGPFLMIGVVWAALLPATT